MSAPLYVFETVPPVGTEILLDAQVYTLVGVEPYVRQMDGKETFLLVWQAECAQCCVPFFCKSGLTVSSLNRRCQTHKRPSQRAGGKRRGQPIEVRVRLP